MMQELEELAIQSFFIQGIIETVCRQFLFLPLLNVLRHKF